MIAAKMVAKGLMTYVVPRAVLNRSAGSTEAAGYCHAVYLHHLTMLDKAGLETDPAVVAELGPGRSVGAGLCALIGGAEQYHGLDVKPYASGAGIGALFDALARLIEERAPLRMKRSERPFPAAVMTEARMRRVLARDRIARLRRAVAEWDEAVIAYRAPWQDPAVVRPGSVDWLFSQSVMEHVDDIEGAYRACFAWLKPGGAMSHWIDYKCHGTAATWNGHLTYSDLAWKLIRGRRGYLINRLPHSAHMAAIERAGFDIMLNLPTHSAGGIRPGQLSPRFAALSDADLKTSGAFIVARKPLAIS